MTDRESGGAAELVLERHFSARAAELRSTRDAVRESVAACGCGPGCTGDIVMAVDEACQNIIRHAYGGECDNPIRLRIERLGNELIFTLHDTAPEIDPAKVKPRDVDDVRPGGLGTHLIQKVMARVEFTRPPSGEGNLLRMVKRIE